ADREPVSVVGNAVEDRERSPAGLAATLAHEARAAFGAVLDHLEQRAAEVELVPPPAEDQALEAAFLRDEIERPLVAAAEALEHPARRLRAPVRQDERPVPGVKDAQALGKRARERGGASCPRRAGRRDRRGP